MLKLGYTTRNIIRKQIKERPISDLEARMRVFVEVHEQDIAEIRIDNKKILDFPLEQIIKFVSYYASRGEFELCHRLRPIILTKHPTEDLMAGMVSGLVESLVEDISNLGNS